MQISAESKRFAATPAAAWQGLEQELEAWRDGGRTLRFWWRDDDAAEETGALSRLRAASEAVGLPVGLAVVPSWLRPSLIDAITAGDHLIILQHGWAHVNHARGSGGRGAWELGMHRGLQPILDELLRGRTVLRDAFGDRFLPVVVPPWNRIDERVALELPALGYLGLSTFGPRPHAGMGPELVVNNCHVDPIRWRGGAAFRGVAATLANCIAHMRAMRLGEVDSNEALGLLTHHLDMDEATWRFTEQFLDNLRQSGLVRFLSPREVFAQ